MIASVINDSIRDQGDVVSYVFKMIVLVIMMMM